MRPKIYLFGDSLTEECFADGWGSYLANHFCRTFDVVLRGYSGYNTRWVLKVLERIFPHVNGGNDESPKAITVFFGANDASLPDRYSAFQHVPLDEYKQNLISIVSFFQKLWPETVVLLITPPPIDEEARLLHPYLENPSGLPERTNNVTSTYAKACTEVAQQCGCPVIDLWTRMQEFPEWKKAYMRDGLHLTQIGNRVVFEEVVVKLKEAGISLENHPCDLPLFTDMDFQNPLSSFEN